MHRSSSSTLLTSANHKSFLDTICLHHLPQLPTLAAPCIYNPHSTVCSQPASPCHQRTPVSWNHAFVVTSTLHIFVRNVLYLCVRFWFSTKLDLRIVTHGRFSVPRNVKMFHYSSIDVDRGVCFCLIFFSFLL